MRELPRFPSGVVTIPSSEVMLEPWKDQEMVRGWSPFLTMQDTCVKSPSFRMLPPNDRGDTSGGSKMEERLLKNDTRSNGCDPPRVA